LGVQLRLPVLRRFDRCLQIVQFLRALLRAGVEIVETLAGAFQIAL